VWASPSSSVKASTNLVMRCSLFIFSTCLVALN
jgi:hypothetical protein